MCMSIIFNPVSTVHNNGNYINDKTMLYPYYFSQKMIR